jgi:hypothetical protein
MNIERAKRALEGQAIQFAPSTHMGDRHRMKVDVTPEFQAVVEDLAYEQGHSIAALLRKLMKEWVKDAILTQEAKEGRYNAVRVA